MTWEAFHRRGDVLDSVIADAATRRDGTLPMDLPGVRETFAGPLDVLGTLHLRWHTRLAGRIERELADEPVDLQAAVVRAWRATDESLPGVRAIIDRHAAEPLDAPMAEAMTRAIAKERHMLAMMAGQVSSFAADEQSVRIGARIEQIARERQPEPAESPRPARAHAAPSFADRLKAAMSAA